MARLGPLTLSHQENPVRCLASFQTFRRHIILTYLILSMKKEYKNTELESDNASNSVFRVLLTANSGFHLEMITPPCAS